MTGLLNTVTPSGAANAIRLLRHSGISLYIHGGPGLAKSSVARQVADEENIALIDLRLSQLAPEDVRGVPMPATIGLREGIIWMPPLVFPRDLDFVGHTNVDSSGIAEIKFHNPLGNNKIPYCTQPKIMCTSLNGSDIVTLDQRADGFTVQLSTPDGLPTSGAIRWSVSGAAKAILALEEFNSAAPSVMAAAYQLILDRRIGDYVVPDGVMLLALGNRDSDRGVTHQLAKPVANRFIHLMMEFSWEDWFVWAGRNNIHADVLGYLSKWQSKANSFDPDSPHLNFATPRSWEFVSRVISQPGAADSATIGALICGAVGDAIGAEFIQHRKFMADMPDVNDILDGAVTVFKPSDPRHETQIAYSVCVQMCYELARRARRVEAGYTGEKKDFNKYPPRRQWLEEADRAFGYAIDNFRPDVTIMASRMAIMVHGLKLPANHLPRFAKFCDTYLPVLMA
jgi:MoxR-like ATPase